MSDESPPPTHHSALVTHHWFSCLFEIPSPFPVRDDRIELALFGAEKVQVVLDDVVAEGLARERALLQRSDRFGEVMRNLWQLERAVDVAFERRWRLGFLRNAVEFRGECGCEREVH